MNLSVHRLVLVAGFGVAVGLAASNASAGEYQLYTSSSTATINGAIFQVDTSHPTGTGFIDSFLRLQQSGSEEGYNTPVRPVQFDEKTDPNFTRNLTYAEAAVVNLHGTDYRAFLLDINENTPGALLTLEQLEIFISPNELTENDYSSTAGGQLTGATKIYDMDSGGGNNWINLDYNLNAGGSGTGDMIVYIPNSLFAGGNTYITLYSQFGCEPQNQHQPTVCRYAHRYSSQAGFEEWWALTGDVTTHSAVPEPGSLLLLGTGALAFVRRRARRAK